MKDRCFETALQTLDSPALVANKGENEAKALRKKRW